MTMRNRVGRSLCGGCRHPPLFGSLSDRRWRWVHRTCRLLDRIDGHGGLRKWAQSATAECNFAPSAPHSYNGRRVPTPAAQQPLASSYRIRRTRASAGQKTSAGQSVPGRRVPTPGALLPPPDRRWRWVHRTCRLLARLDGHGQPRALALRATAECNSAPQKEAYGCPHPLRFCRHRTAGILAGSLTDSTLMASLVCWRCAPPRSATPRPKKRRTGAHTGRASS